LRKGSISPALSLLEPFGAAPKAHVVLGTFPLFVIAINPYKHKE